MIITTRKIIYLISLVLGIIFSDIAAAANIDYIQIKTSDGKEFNVTQQEVKIFSTLKNITTDIPESNEAIELANITSQTWELLEPLINLFLTNDIAGIKNKIRENQYSLQEIVNLINAVDFLDNDNLSKILLDGLALKILVLIPTFQKEDVLYISQNLAPAFLNDLKFELVLRALGGYDYHLKPREIIVPNYKWGGSLLKFNPKHSILAVDLPTDPLAYNLGSVIEFISINRDKKNNTLFKNISYIRSFLPYAFDFSDDNAMFAYNHQGYLNIYTIIPPKFIKSVPLKPGIELIAFHPHNNNLIAVLGNSIIQLLDIKTGKSIKTLTNVPIGSSLSKIIFSSDGNILILKTMNIHGNYLKAWNIDTEDLLWTIDPNKLITSINLTPDGQLFTILSDGTIELRDFVTSNIIKTINMPPTEQPIYYTASFGGHNRLLAIGAETKLFLLDSQTLEIIATLPINLFTPVGIRNTIKNAILQTLSVTFHPYELMLAVARKDTHIIFYDWQFYIDMSLEELLTAILNSANKP